MSTGLVILVHKAARIKDSSVTIVISGRIRRVDVALEHCIRTDGEVVVSVRRVLHFRRVRGVSLLILLLGV